MCVCVCIAERFPYLPGHERSGADGPTRSGQTDIHTLLGSLHFPFPLKA